MKQPLSLFISGLLFFQTVFAVEIDVHSKVESVIVYHSGALVNRVGTIDLKPGVNEITFKNISSKIILNSIKVGNKEVTILNKSLIRKLTKEEVNQLQDRREALNKQLTLIESKYNQAGFVGKVEDLEKMTAFYGEKMVQLKKELRSVELKIEEAKKLENIELKNENAAILKLIVSVEEKLKEPLELQYVCGGIGWSPYYEVNVKNAGESKIGIKYLARVMSQTGEDWDNISISLSSSFPLESPTSIPKAKNPWVLAGGKYSGDFENPNENKPQVQEQQQIDKLEGVSYQEISIPSFLKLRVLKDKYSIKSNSTVFTFPIQSISLPTDFFYFGYPGVDPEVYLVAQVTGWDTLGFVDGVAGITFGGNEIGKSLIKFSEFKDTLLLPVGKDNSVFMKRHEIPNQKYFRITTIGKKREITLAYRFELKNNNPFPVKFELVEQFHISQTKLAEVELETISGGKINKEEGEITWLMDLKPGQGADKEFVFKIEMDASYRYSKSSIKKAKYRTISAPSF